MTIKSYLIGENDPNPINTHTRDGDVGQIVYTKSFRDGVTTGTPFLNETFGIAMNQDVSFGGTPEIIHDGGDTSGWTGAANAGTWDFAAAGLGVGGGAAVTITSADNLDSASFTDATETDMSGYTAFTGQVNLITYAAANNSILLQAKNNTVNVGTSINLNDYINTGTTGSYQGFVIPKDDMSLAGETIDELEIIITRTVGGKPTIYFDVIQIEETGSPAVFKVTPNPGTKLQVNRIVYQWADVGTGGTAYSYNKIGAIPQLSNGITLTSMVSGEVTFSSTLTQLSDFILTGGVVENHVDDGTNTFVSIGLNETSGGGVILNSEEDDFFSLTINDDLSGLLLFSAFVSGFQEVL